MILGKGTALTEEAIIEEYQHFVGTHSGSNSPRSMHWLKTAPNYMRRTIGKPLTEWSDEDILQFCQGRSMHAYHAFVLFLFHRGYRRVPLSFLTAFNTNCTIIWGPALLPLRQKLLDANKSLGRGRSADVGSQLRLLLWLLFTTGKSLEDVTRADFDAFRDEYLQWYRSRRKRSDSYLFRLEQSLIQMGLIPKTILSPDSRLEVGLEAIQHESFITAMLLFLNWCKGKYPLEKAYARKYNLLYFFSWLQKHYPACSRFNEITRLIALAYAQHLKDLNEDGRIGVSYQRQRHADIRKFVDFVMEEKLETAPSRNPFSTGDVPRQPNMVPRYLSDQELRQILTYCENEALLIEKTVMTVLLHTGIRAAELAALKHSDMVQVGGRWKLHIRLGKGLKDRVIPLTPLCVQVLQEWNNPEHNSAQKQAPSSGQRPGSESLFSYYGRPWKDAGPVGKLVHNIGKKSGVPGLTAHRFRHTFAVTLLNYGIRETALQKLMGHETLNMTLEYARILDETVEKGFTQAVEQMQEGPLSWVPNFFVQEDYTMFAEGDSVSWIQLPVGFCRRNPKLHCESDVKCFLCERFWGTVKDLPRLQQMQERFLKLGFKLKADVVAAQIKQIEERAQGDTAVKGGPTQAFIPLASVAGPSRR